MPFARRTALDTWVSALSQEVSFPIHLLRVILCYGQENLYPLIQQAVFQRLQEADLTARMRFKTRKERLPVAQAEVRSPLTPNKSVSAPPAREKEPSQRRR